MAWLAASRGGGAAFAVELPVALVLGAAVLVMSTTRLTVSDSGLSFDVGAA